jgi:hypothetical protein
MKPNPFFSLNHFTVPVAIHTSVLLGPLPWQKGFDPGVNVWEGVLSKSGGKLIVGFTAV